jgi:hypothetical protein
MIVMLTAEEHIHGPAMVFHAQLEGPSFRPLALGLRSLHVLITVGVLVKFKAP